MVHSFSFLRSLQAIMGGFFVVVFFHFFHFFFFFTVANVLRDLGRRIEGPFVRGIRATGGSFTEAWIKSKCSFVRFVRLLSTWSSDPINFLPFQVFHHIFPNLRQT